jgi:hypothetical protein
MRISQGFLRKVAIKNNEGSGNNRLDMFVSVHFAVSCIGANRASVDVQALR